ncbi:hypothetical protein [Haloferax sp. DFSO52]|uniref:DUF7344 domain-containing protein n=1 Tax=Haloferax sp. DFSO52 TaxID=3388505 RepID=UPI003A87D977
MSSRSAKREPTASNVFDALANRRRRQLLFSLFDADTDTDETIDPVELIADVAEIPDSQATSIELHHVHLPQLDTLGFIEWDSETNEVGHGAAWDEIAPVLDLLQSNQDRFAEELL